MAKKPQVLIIEDDLFITKAMRLQFQAARVGVKTALTAEGGLKILSEWRPDAIVLDIVLPGIDGYEFLKIVKADTRFNQIPVIVASNLPRSEVQTKGVTDYIVKSDLDLKELVKKTLKNIN